MYCIIYVGNISNDLAPTLNGDVKIVQVYSSERGGIRCAVLGMVLQAKLKVRTIIRVSNYYKSK